MKVKVTINGEKAELNSYVEGVFAKILNALISTLKGTEKWNKVLIEMER